MKTELLLPHLQSTLNVNWNRLEVDTNDSYQEITFEEWISGFDWCSSKLGRLREANTEMQLHLKKKGYLDLSWNRMLSIQKIILGYEVSFRRTEAFCKNKRYCYFENLDEIFKEKVYRDSSDHASSLSKALRLYLDIIHFHAFPDGNARAAMLWFYHILFNGSHNIPRLGHLLMISSLNPSIQNYLIMYNYLKFKGRSRCIF